MAWKWDTFKEWVPESGTTVKVVVAAGLLAAGGLLWYERAQPRYPTARDEAEIVGALVERLGIAQAYGYGWGKFRHYPVLDGGVWTNEPQWHAVGLYPDRDFYLIDVTNAMRLMENDADWLSPGRWVDLAVPGSFWGGQNTGAERLSGRAWTNDDAYAYNSGSLPFVVEEWMDFGWWTNHIWAAAPHHGSLPYATNRPFYLGTNILNQIARPLTAYRWSFDRGVALRVTNDWPNMTIGGIVQVAVGYGDGSSEDAAIDAAIDAMSWEFSMPESAFEHLKLRSHYVSAWAWYDEDEKQYSAIVVERVSAAGGIFFYPQLGNCLVPEFPGLVRKVTEHAVVTAPYSYVMHPGGYLNGYNWWGDDHLGASATFYHPLGFASNVWEYLDPPAEEIEGVTTNGYWAYSHMWDGLFDKSEMKRLLNANEDCMGWGAGPSVFVIDWRFQCLTNRAAYWESAQ